MLLCCTAISGALYVLIYYVPLFYSLVRNEDGIQTAIRLLPLVCFYIFGVMLNGVFMVRWGYRCNSENWPSSSRTIWNH
jgi:hypothetical protein